MNLMKSMLTALIALTLLGCGGAVVNEGDPGWIVSMMSRGPCTSISGIYQDKGLLFTQFVDSSVSYSRPKFSVTRGFGKNVPQKPLSADELKRIGAISGKQIVAAQMKNYAEQREKFNSTALTKIENTSNGLRVTLYGGDGEPFSQSDIATGHPDVGCSANENLVLRESSRAGGSELTPGEASVSEVIFSKSNDGSLEVRRWSRNWVRTMQQPPSKKTEAVLSFPPAR
jgi:hypothetical protein